MLRDAKRRSLRSRCYSFAHQEMKTSRRTKPDIYTVYWNLRVALSSLPSINVQLTLSKSGTLLGRTSLVMHGSSSAPNLPVTR